MSEASSLRIEASNPNFNQPSINEVGQGMEIIPLPSALPVELSEMQSGPVVSSDSPQHLQTNDGVILHGIIEHEAQQQIAVQNVHIARGKIDGMNVAAKEEVKLMVQQKIKQRHEIVATDQGVRLRRYTVAETVVYGEIFQDFYIEAQKQPQAIEEGGDPEVTPTKFETCIDLCCQSCVCSYRNPFRRQQDPNQAPLIKKRELMTPILRRGRAKGWNIFTKVVFPLVLDWLRDIWVIAELLLVLTGIILSIATFTTGSNETFNVIHLAFSIFSTVLAVLDAVISLAECKSCKACNTYLNNRGQQPENGNDMTESADPKADHIKNSSKTTGCKKCYNRFKTSFDIGRVLLTEMILIPLLLCDIFEVVTGFPKLGEDVSNRLGFALFLIGCVGLILYVYVIRLIILGFTICRVLQVHTPPTGDQKELAKVDYDPVFRKGALIFQLFFFFHVFGQMVAQVFMLIAIAGKVRYDNQHLYDPSNTDNQIYVSPELWYMCIAVYFLPVCGFFTFFIVTNFWMQEFPISLCIDFIKILQLPGVDNILYMEFAKKDTKDVEMMVKFVAEFVRIDKLSTQYRILRNTNILDKFIYPFKSPILVILCLAYAGCQLAFVVCAAIAMDETGQIAGQILNGGGWIIYYIFAVAVGVVANFYVFAVAAFWIIVVAAVIALILAIIGLLCFCACVTSSSSTSNQRN